MEALSQMSYRPNTPICPATNSADREGESSKEGDCATNYFGGDGEAGADSRYASRSMISP